MKSSILISCLFLSLAFLLPAESALAQFSTRPAPMWEDYEKTAADLESDKKFIREATELAGGDANAAAHSLIEIGWQRIGQDANHAIRAFNQAWLIQPDNPNIFWGFAVASHIRKDELKTVNRWFARTRQLMALKGLPDSARFEADQGRVMEERKFYKEARPYFEKALSLQPKYLQAHIGMINVAKALGDKKLQDKHQKMHDELVK
jgi:tetratricopeptide (TPR) repeat protein